MPWAPGRRVAKYHELKASGHCTKCRAGLAEDWHRTICPECAEIEDLETMIERKTPEGAARHAANAKAAYHRNAAKGLCAKCGARPPRPGVRTCADCAEIAKRALKNYRARKRQGIIPIGAARRAQKDRERRELEERLRELKRPRLAPLDDGRGEPRRRILRGLLRLDWIRTRDLWIALEVEELDDLDRWTSALSRAAKAGLVEVRGPRMEREYHLSPAGRAVALELAEAAA